MEASDVRADRRQRRCHFGEGAGTLPHRARRGPRGHLRWPATRQSWRIVSRAMPRRCADTTSPTVADRAAIGWSASAQHAGPLSVRSAQGAELGKGAAGKWTDAASGEHGDLLDVIRESCGLVNFHDVVDEARRFLSLPQMNPEPRHKRRSLPAPVGSSESARRLFAMSQPIPGTLVEAYLRNRGITDLRGTGALRFHPRCYYRPDNIARPRRGRR